MSDLTSILMANNSAKFLKDATDFDAQNKFFEAFLKYLEATASLCLDIAEKCKSGMENAFSNYASQRMKMISHCYERAKSMQELIAPNQQSSSTLPVPNENLQVIRRTDNLAVANTPEELAKEINRKLILRHRESISHGQYTDAELALKDIALQKKLLENVSLAEQKTRKSHQISVSPPTRRSVGSTLSNAKNELSAGINTLRRSTNDSSGSSIGRRSTEPYRNCIPANIEVDSDMEAGPKLPSLETIFDPELVRAFGNKEKLRQISIVEFIHTEKTHVGQLKILSKIIYYPLKKNSILPDNFVQFAPCNLLSLIFPNLEEILEIHSNMNQTLKSLNHSKLPVDHIGDVLLKFFDREGGEKLKNASVHFCRYQQYALEQIEECKNQNLFFNSFLSEVQNYPLCKNLTLSGQLLKEMQRLSKYPLLIDQIIKYTEECETEEIQKLQRCLQCTKQILEATNEAKHSFDSWKKLTELQLVLDTSKFDHVNHPVVKEFEKFDLRKYSFVHDGFLSWKQGNHKVTNIHGVLLDEALILLTRKRDKLLLKFHGAAYTTDKKTGEIKILRYCPIVVLSAVEVKDDPSDDSRFFIHETNADHVPPYELSARSVGEKTLWLKHLQEQINKINRKTVVSHEPHSLVEEMDVAKPHQLPNSQFFDASAVSADSHQIEAVANVNLIRKMRRNDGIIFNSLLNKHKYLAEILNVTPESLEALAKVIETNIEEYDLKNLTAAAIVQDGIVELIAKADYEENMRTNNNHSNTSFGSVPCTLLSPTVSLLSKYLNVILTSLV